MREPDRLIDAYLDGTITEPEFADLRAWLTADPAHADRFADRSLLHRHALEHLTHDAADAAPVGAPAALPAPPKPRAAAQRGPGVSPLFRLPRPLLALSALAAAVLLFAAAVTLYLATAPASNSELDTLNPEPDSPVATVLDTTGGGTLTVGEAIVTPGADIHTGTLRLDAGAAEVRLTSGTSVTLTGAAQLTVRDPMHAALALGRASFHCPPEAAGFVVDLPGDRRIVDLGTGFDVWLDSRGDAVIAVLSGRIRIESPRHDSVYARGGFLRLNADGSTQPITPDLPAGYAYHTADADAPPFTISGPLTLVERGNEVRFHEYGSTPGAGFAENLARLGQAFASARIDGYGPEKAFDGRYTPRTPNKPDDDTPGNERPWIAMKKRPMTPSTLGVRFAEPRRIGAFAFGSRFGDTVGLGDRDAGTFTLQYTRDADASAQADDPAWVTIGSVVVHPGPRTIGRHLFAFDPVEGVRAVRLRVTDADAGGLAVQEFEIYDRLEVTEPEPSHAAPPATQGSANLTH